MPINSVASSRTATAHATMPPPAKKPAVNFTDVMNAAGQSAVQQANAGATAVSSGATTATQTAKA
ncbi:MAG: hypothetical protein GAK35_02738 [Herbaspirillum frisingense]|uniref:Uncharacterized protein n=1 Tax=Herbaspirillum frisingense TaxID=92645 RepID=A0A7V8FVN1_9BURK|nr:MAG: hypothetical protein GAK35_02738 [Herbaspirillum frisingense]